MSEIDRMLADNRAWAEGFSGGGLPAQPARKVAVVACMDARIPLLPMLGLEVGDAHVIRNAGGVITDDTVRSVAVSQHLLGTREVLLVHHTRCGMEGADDAAFADQLERASGARPSWPLQSFASAEDDVRASARRLRESPFLLSREIRGTVYDVDTGLLHEVA